jgi:hypothetical protein
MRSSCAAIAVLLLLLLRTGAKGGCTGPYLDSVQQPRRAFIAACYQVPALCEVGDLVCWDQLVALHNSFLKIDGDIKRHPHAHSISTYCSPLLAAARKLETLKGELWLGLGGCKG